MKGHTKSFYLLLILSCVLIIECKIPKQVGSNDPVRPFQYGQPFTLEECTADIKYFTQDIGFRPGDVVADVGAGNGYLEGAFSVVTDSIEFYIEDINRKVLNTSEFNKVINYYTNLRGKTFTNTFFIHITEFLIKFL